MILGWLVNDKEIESKVLTNKQKVREEDVEMVDFVNNAIIEDNVNLSIVKYLFTQEAWLCVEDIKKTKAKLAQKNKLLYFCSKCKGQMISSSVICESCLQWTHLRCVGKFSKKKSWFCAECSRN